MARNPNPFYHKHECEKCAALSDCYLPECQSRWYEDLCRKCYIEGLYESAAIIAEWPEWKRDVLRW